MQLRTTIFPRFADLPQSLRSALERDQSHEVFYSLSWFENLAREVFAHEELRLLHASAEKAGGLAQMLLPMAVAGNPGDRPKPRELQGISNYYSSLFGPIPADVESGDVDELTRGLAQLIADANPAWDIIDLHPLDDETEFWHAMRRQLRTRGFWVDSYFCFGNWYLPVRGMTFETYLDGRRAQLKSALKSGTKRVFRDNGSNLVIVTQPGPELERAIEAYVETYDRSWKKAEPYPGFIPNLCRLAAAKGWLRLGVLFIDNRPAAAQIWLVKDGKASIYKLAYDEAFAKSSPGTVLTAALMKHAIDVDKVSEVDYLAGDDAYKRGWMSDRRERRGMVAFNPRRVRGVLFAARHFGGTVLRATSSRFRSVLNSKLSTASSKDQ